MDSSTWCLTFALSSAAMRLRVGDAEEFSGCLGVGGLHGGDVDDGVDPSERVIETCAAGHVDAMRAGDYDGVLACPPLGIHAHDTPRGKASRIARRFPDARR
jgi:hypothetical protein